MRITRQVNLSDVCIYSGHVQPWRGVQGNFKTLCRQWWVCSASVPPRLEVTVKFARDPGGLNQHPLGAGMTEAVVHAEKEGNQTKYYKDGVPLGWRG